MRNIKFYFLNLFKVYSFNSAEYIHIVVQPVSITHLVYKTNSIPRERILIPSFTELLETSLLLSVSMNLTMLGTSCLWNHVFVLL